MAEIGLTHSKQLDDLCKLKREDLQAHPAITMTVVMPPSTPKVEKDLSGSEPLVEKYM